MSPEYFAARRDTKTSILDTNLTVVSTTPQQSKHLLGLAILQSGEHKAQDCREVWLHDVQW